MTRIQSLFLSCVVGALASEMATDSRVGVDEVDQDRARFEWSRSIEIDQDMNTWIDDMAEAIRSNNIGEIFRICKDTEFDVNKEIVSGWPPLPALHYAASLGRHQAVHTLLHDCGADANLS